MKNLPYYRLGRICLHIIAAAYSINHFRFPHLGFVLQGIKREIMGM